MILTLHDIENSVLEVSVDSIKIIDLEFASYCGGSIITTLEGMVFVDENPNHVSLLAGFIHGDKHCSTGSKSGTRNYYVRRKNS